MTEPEKKGTEEHQEDYEEEEEVEEESGDEEEEEEEEDKEEPDEKEEVEEIKPVKKRRCQRRSKTARVCLGELDDDEEEFGVLCTEEGEEEGEEEEEGGEEDEGELWEASSVSSILSAISFVWENEVYEFEELCDPGTIQTFHKSRIAEHEVGDKYGVRRYVEMCNILNIAPVASILKALETEEIDLSYRNLDTRAIKAISAALLVNTTVRRLIVKWNDLRTEDCHHLGRIMNQNKITYLDFTGSSLEPEALGYLVAFLTKNDSVTDLNLSKCNIRDEGMKTLAYVLTLNSSIENLDLSYNKLEAPSGDTLALVVMSNSSLTSLNLRYNNLFEPSTMKNFFRYLSINYSVTRLDLSWNSMSGVEMGTYIGTFLKKNETIGYLDLSDNRFEGAAVIPIKKGLAKSKSLTTLKLGKNPLLSGDIEILLGGVKLCQTLQVLDLEDLWIDKNILKVVNKIKKDRDLKINYEGLLGDYEIKGPDYPKLILCRAQFEAQKPKQAKKKKDFGHLIWTLGDEAMTKDDFMLRVKKFKAKIAKPLFPELINQYLNPKNNLIDVVAMREKYLSIFPDSKPPPPPKPKKGKKGKGAVEEVKEVPAEDTEGADEREGELVLGESAEELFIDEEYEDEEGEFADNEAEAEDLGGEGDHVQDSVAD